MSYAVEVQHLRRVYKITTGFLKRSTKEIEAVKEVSFEIAQGELFGLLGPNGAGKTTTIKMLTTLLIPSSGQARIFGLDVVKQAQQLRSRIGFIFGGERGLYWRLSGIDNLRYFAALYRLDPSIAKQRIPYLLELVGLGERGKERVEGYSRGMKQRLHIARTLLHDPDLIFLDEPTIGLDPVGARELREMVKQLQSAGKTILLTTHYMFEADELCQRIAVINKGQLVALDTPVNLKQLVSDLAVIELVTNGLPTATLDQLRQQTYIEAVSVEDRGGQQAVMIQTPLGSQAVPSVLELVNGAGVARVTVREPSLEDAYVRLMERGQ
jgi:ABC-2 type transport system ATP-binding protein